MLNRNHALSVFDPFREMEKIEKHFFDDPWGNFSRTFTDSFRTDVTDEGDHFKITADLPGFEKENIHLDLYDDALTISAERHSEHENKDKRDKYLCCERSYGSYSRTFNVTGIDTVFSRQNLNGGLEGGELVHGLLRALEVELGDEEHLRRVVGQRGGHGLRQIEYPAHVPS